MGETEERRLMYTHSGEPSTPPVPTRGLANYPAFELIFGGRLYFKNGDTTPSEEVADYIIGASFEGERSAYYVELLQEKYIDIGKIEFDSKLPSPSSQLNENASNDGGEGFPWAGLMIGMSSAIGVGLLAAGSRLYSRKPKRELLTDDLKKDLENGSSYKDYAIRLQYTNDEIYLPGTVTMTPSSETESEDLLSVPSLRGEQDEATLSYALMSTPGGALSSLDSSPTGASIGDMDISPLESPRGLAASSAASLCTAQTETRYVSVFPVKKDCGGKSIDEVDIRALAIAYLSRMLKKYPNTHLLPYDKNVPLPPITNIRNIPDDLEELRQYVGNPRTDDRTGKVLFNLRVESDEPVSKMKSSSRGRGTLNKYKPPSNQQQEASIVVDDTSVELVDKGRQRGAHETPKSP